VNHVAVFAVVALAADASADPLRLRADALATTQSPAGLLVLEADGKATATVNAEALVWTGSDRQDVLVAVVRARTEDGRVGGKVGRFVATLGALRPVQIDGAAGRVRLPNKLDVEAYAGSPVVVMDQMSERAWDWVAGGRVARRLGTYGSVGVAFMEQRDDGRLATRELGLDAGYAINKHHDAAAQLAYDVANPGLADVRGSVIRRKGKNRSELYGGYRAASHLLPATSLFTVLGDTASARGGLLLTRRVAPRLELTSDTGVRGVGDDVAPLAIGRARLALDDDFKSALTGELRRDGVGDDAWTGARGAARVALPHSLVASTELEVVVPDDSDGRGTVWPWALAALGWERGPWRAAGAVEASASPEYRRRIDVLFQLTREWGAL
jgi:hypothetical protein